MATRPDSATVFPHIEITPDVCGGVNPALRGPGSAFKTWSSGTSGSDCQLTRLSVVILNLRWPGSMPLTYYHDHRDAIEAEMEAGQAIVMEMRRLYPSKIAAKLSIDSA